MFSFALKTSRLLLVTLFFIVTFSNNFPLLLNAQTKPKTDQTLPGAGDQSGIKTNLGLTQADLDNSSCNHPTDWLEKENSRQESVNIYFKPKKAGLPTSSTPTTNPENYYEVICSFAEKINFKDTDGKFKKIDTGIVKLKISSDKNEGLEYITGANSFKAYFPRDPNNGWKYVNTETNTNIRIKSVSISGNKLNFIDEPVVLENTITYTEVLPNLDLKYVVDASGVNKYFVIKNKLGLLNDFSKISFELESNKNFVRDYQKIKISNEDKSLLPLSLSVEDTGKVVFEKPYTIDNKTLEAKFENYQLSPDNKNITITPDLNYLKSSEREFPILIDPKLISPYLAATDTFVRDNSPNAPQGTANRHMLSVGGNFYDPTTSTWLGTTRSFIKFSLPAEINDSSSVVWSNFRLRQYATYGGGFRAKIYRLNAAFDESKMTWNNQVGTGSEYGFVDFEKVNLNGNGNGKDIWSSDIAGLVRDSVGTGQVLVGLRDENESATRGVAVCAKDGNISGHPCNNADKGPVLQIYLNQKPTPPNAESPFNRDDVLGNCDLSTKTGNCDRTAEVNYRVSNVNDGDNDCNLANVKLVQKDSVSFPSSWYNLTGPVKGCGVMNIRQQVPNGKYSWAAINQDNYGLESNWSNIQEFFTIDTQPPFQTKDLDIPRYSKDNKVSFQAPGYADNLLQKIRINLPDTNLKRSLDVDGRLYGGVYSNLQIWDSYGGQNQEFVYNTASKEIRSINGKCLDAAGINNGARVYTYDCHGGANQQWIFTNQQSIQNLAANKCLELQEANINNGTQVFLQDCSEKPSQKWNLQISQKLRLKINGQNLSVDNTCLNPGCNIHLYNSHNGENQSFEYTQQQELKSVNNLCVDAASVSVSGNIYLANCHGGANQKWLLDEQNNQIKSIANNSLCINVAGNLSSGGNIELASCSDNTNQKFVSEPFSIFNNPNQRLSYLVQISKNVEFTDLVNADQTWTTVPKFEIGGLATGNNLEKTFYVRMKSRDRSNGGNTSPWTTVKTTVQDPVLPLVRNLAVDTTRFSPKVLNAKNLNIQAEFSEKNFESAKILIYDTEGKLVKSLTECAKLSNQVPIPCNSKNINYYYSSDVKNEAQENFSQNKLNFVWDGKEASGKSGTSESYVLQVVVTDKAGNTNNLQLANSKIALNSDNNPPKINISSPINGFWVNQPNIEIKGAVGITDVNSKLFEMDVASLEIAKVNLDNILQDSTSLNYKKINFDLEKGNTFNITEKLVLGKNKFKFKAADDLGNSNTQLGLPPSQEYLEVDYENTPPQILDLGIIRDALNNTNTNSTLAFTIQDPKKIENQISGLQLHDKNKLSGVDISLLKLQANNSGWSEIKLYQDGVNLTAANNQARLAGDLKCTSAEISKPESSVKCTLPLTNLPDGYYKLYLRISDRAGNSSCNFNYSEISKNIKCDLGNYQNTVAEFQVKTQTYLQVLEPKDTQNLAQNKLNFSGNIEKGATLKISNNLLDRYIEAKIEKTENILPREYVSSTKVLMSKEAEKQGRLFSGNTEPLKIICEGKKVKLNDTSPELEICSYSITLTQQDNYSDTNKDPGINVKNNLNNISVVDNFENSLNFSKNAVVDLYGINLSSEPSTILFSPNGDSRFDSLIFKSMATKMIDGSDYTENIKSYKAELIDAKGNLVWRTASVTPAKSLDGLYTQGVLNYKIPASIDFDGKSNIGLSNGQWLANGDYKYTFSFTTLANVTFTTNPQTISAKSNLTGETVILSPANNFTTTRGLINVQGQGPAGWIVDICLQAMVKSDSQQEMIPGCNVIESTIINANGFYSAIINLPSNNTQYQISAVSKDTVGNKTPKSNTVKVNLDFTGPLKSAQVNSDLGGANTPEKIQDFLAGKINIKDLRSAQLKAVVTQNTEVLDLDFADYTNLTELPGTDPQTGQVKVADSVLTNLTKIATINDTTETNLNKNPGLDNSIKKDLASVLGAGQNGKDLTGENRKICAQNECTWVFNFPYPANLKGGIYEVRFRAYKGETIQDFTQSFIINGVIPAAPSVLLAQKENIKAICQVAPGQNCLEYQDITKIEYNFYTNSSKLKFIGAADIDTKLKLSLKDSKDKMILQRETNANTFGMWNLELELPAAEDRYSLELQSTKNQISSSILRKYYVILDKTSPDLNWVQTETSTAYNSFAINPWVNSSMVNFKIQANEPIYKADLFDSSGKTIYKGYKEIPTVCRNFSPQEIESLSTKITTDCKKQYLLQSQINASLVPQSMAEEGIYAPIIHLEDLAGNKVFYSNVQANLDSLEKTLHTLNANHPFQKDQKILVSLFDSKGSLLSNIQNGDNVKGTKALPLNYPYAQQPRSKSLDFRLFVDLHDTKKTDFELCKIVENPPTGCYADKIDGISADAQTPEADRIMTDSSWFAKTKPCQQISAVECSPKPVYTIRGDKLYLKGRLEKNQRIVLVGQKRKSTDPNYQEIFTLTPATTTQDCLLEDPKKVDTINNNLIVEFNSLCQFNAVFNFNDDGLSPNGVPINYYTFSFYPLDLAGNTAPIYSINGASTISKSLVLNNNQPVLVGNSDFLSNPKPNPDNLVYKDNALIVTKLNSTLLSNIGSSVITVYHDTDSPKNTTITNIKSKNYDPIIDFQSTGSGSSAIVGLTKDTSINTTIAGEQLADIEIKLQQTSNTFKGSGTGPVINQEISKRIQIRDDFNTEITTSLSKILKNGKSNDPDTSANLTLGATTQDDSKKECMVNSDNPVKNRRIGICADGLYTIGARGIDTAGNRSNFVESKLERDTVSPAKPILTVSKVADPAGAILGEYLGMDLVAEAGTKVIVNIEDGYENKFTNAVNVNSNGVFGSKNILGTKLYCGNVKYKIKVRVMDRAENVSVFSDTKTITTEDCPSCNSSGNAELSMPLKSAKAYISAGFGVYEPAHKGPHAGIDIAANINTSVYAARAGKVLKVNMGNDSTDSYGAGWGNFVIIEHYDSNKQAYLQTIYAHLVNSALVKVNQEVGINTIIGKVGSSGNSTGAHLHFQVEKKDAYLESQFTGRYNRWAPVDPRKFLGKVEGNLSEAQKKIYCDNQTGIGDSIIITYPEITDDEARTIFAKYILDNLGDKTKIERDDEKYNLYTDKSELVATAGGNLNNLKLALTPGKICEAVWYHHLGTIYRGSNQSPAGDDGVIVVNNYTKKAYLVQNGIFEKWINTNGCGIVGVPSAEEVNFNPQKGSIGARDKGWYQRFRRGDYIDNSIYAYQTDSGKDCYIPPAVGSTTIVCNMKPGFYSFLVVEDVAKEYENKGGAGGLYSLPITDTYGAGNKQYCKQEFEIEILNLCKDLEERLIVNGKRSNTDGILKNSSIRKDSRRVSLAFVDINDENKYRYAYGDNKNIWILSHGWNDTPESFAEIANRIKLENPNDIVLLLDWSEASFNDHGTCGINCPTGVTRAATWIGPVADKVSQKLKLWGFDYKNKLRLVGHSLGSIMSGELSERFGQARVVIALDPPSETFDADIDRYKVYANPSEPRKNFREYAQFSRSFVGEKSLAGNHEFAKSADESYVLDFGDSVDFGAEHSDVVKTFNNIILYKFYSNYLDSKDIPTIEQPNNVSKSVFDPDFSSGFTGKIRVDKNESGNERAFVQQLAGKKNGKNLVFGTQNGNKLNMPEFVTNSALNNTDIFGGLGDDVFYNFNQNITGKYAITIKDFGNNGDSDRINLLGDLPMSGGNKIEVQYRYINNNGEVKLQQRTVDPSFQTSTWADSVKVDGDKRGDINDETLKQKSADLFDFR